MKVPTKLIVCGHSVNIRWSHEDSDLFGDCDSDNGVITLYLCNHKSEAQLLDSLFHEVMHMVFAITGVNEVFEDNEEETVVRCLENNLKKLIRLDRRKWRNTIELETNFE